MIVIVTDFGGGRRDGGKNLTQGGDMAYLNMKQLLEAGVHFGHQTNRWHPKMRPYIFTARNGIYIIDLQRTVKMSRNIYDFVKDEVSKGGKVLFVGTKKQAQTAIEEEARRCGMFFVSQRWLGGTLTNYNTIKKSIEKLKRLEAMKEQDSYNGLTKKEVLQLERARTKLEKYLGGIKDMEGLPDIVFVIDVKKEHIAVCEARKLHIPVVAVVDTNCDPDYVDYIIPGNDDAIRAIKLFASNIAEACLEGKALYEESLRAVSDKAEEETAADEEAVETVEPESSEPLADEEPKEETVGAASQEAETKDVAT